MTKQEYSNYESAVAHNLTHLTFVSTGGCPGCDECGLNDEPSEGEIDLANEGRFSWSACECCNSSLGGNRYAAHGRDANNELVHFQVCEDCLYYINYGKLDDATMMHIEAS